MIYNIRFQIKNQIDEEILLVWEIILIFPIRFYLIIICGYFCELMN